MCRSKKIQLKQPCLCWLHYNILPIASIWHYPKFQSLRHVIGRYTHFFMKQLNTTAPRSRFLPQLLHKLNPTVKLWEEIQMRKIGRQTRISLQFVGCQGLLIVLNGNHFSSPLLLLHVAHPMTNQGVHYTRKFKPNLEIYILLLTLLLFSTPPCHLNFLWSHITLTALPKQ